MTRVKNEIYLEAKRLEAEGEKRAAMRDAENRREMLEMKTKLKASDAWIAALQSGLGSIAVASDLWQGNPPSHLSGQEAAIVVASATERPEGSMPIKPGMMLPRLPLTEGEGSPVKETSPAHREQREKERKLLSDMGHGSSVGSLSPKPEGSSSNRSTPRGNTKINVIMAERRALEAQALREIGSSSPRREGAGPNEQMSPRPPGSPPLLKPPEGKQHGGKGSGFWATHFETPGEGK